MKQETMIAAMKWILCSLIVFGLPASAFLSRPLAQQPVPSILHEAIGWLGEPGQIQTEYNYTMTGQVRLLLFWVGRDDVGGGYIRLGKASAGVPADVIDLKFGSDPLKAPRQVNRWGAARELHAVRDVNGRSVPTSAFFGFMKPTGGASREEIESTLSDEEKDRRYLFEAIVNRVEPGAAMAAVLRLASDVDFTMHQYDEAWARVLSTYGSPNAAISLRGPSGTGCDRSEGFLFAVRDMVEGALSGSGHDRSVCYVYNSRLYTLALRGDARVASQRIDYTLQGNERHDVTYRDLRRLDFEVLNHESRVKTTFRLLVGASGDLRGVPVRIEHQPNWWFKVILNLHPGAGTALPS